MGGWCVEDLRWDSAAIGRKRLSGTARIAEILEQLERFGDVDRGMSSPSDYSP